MSDTPETDLIAKRYDANEIGAAEVLIYAAQLERKNAALKAENAALREDKARLDWLDGKGRNLKNVNMDGIWREWSHCHCDYVNTKTSLRKAIDAARKEAQP